MKQFLVSLSENSIVDLWIRGFVNKFGVARLVTFETKPNAWEVNLKIKNYIFPVPYVFYLNNDFKNL